MWPRAVLVRSGGFIGLRRARFDCEGFYRVLAVVLGVEVLSGLRIACIVLWVHCDRVLNEFLEVLEGLHVQRHVR